MPLTPSGVWFGFVGAARLRLKGMGFDRALRPLSYRPAVARRPAKGITLDLDATDIPLHGPQEGRFFHGY